MTDGPDSSLTVVGIGASAGGLSALRAFFGTIEKPPGFAFIVVQHLDPDHESLMSEIINRHTIFSVAPAEHKQRLRADTVYVAPPGKRLRVEGPLILVEEPTQERYHRTPIDQLFKSLAQAHGPASFGIVLSGTGTDGVEGIRAIKDAGGVAMAQDPENAEFDGMPKAAIDTGLVDVVDVPAALLDRLVSIIKKHPQGDGDGLEGAEGLLDVLHRQTGYDFKTYKTGTLTRRIRRRMALGRVPSDEEYRKMLEDDPGECDQLVKDLLIGVTRFFRDPEAWQQMARVAIDPLIQEMADGDVLRAWTAGCATGEEAYTLAMLITERLEHSGKAIELQLFATDLNVSAIESARAGVYSASSFAEMDQARIDRFFSVEGEMYKVAPSLREKIVFAAQNLLTDPPFSSVHLVTCRNLLIYLDRNAQRRLIDTFHFALREGGYLALGLAESMESGQTKFETMDKTNRIFRRLNGTARLPSPLRRESKGDDKKQEEVKLTPLGANAAVRQMLSRFAPPAVLLSEEFDLVSIHGEVGDFMEFERGTLSSNFLSLVSEQFHAQVWTALNTARRDNRPVELHHSAQGGDEGDLTILAEPIISSGQKFFLIYFIKITDGDVPGAQRTETEVGADVKEQYQQEITILQQHLQAVIEKKDTSHEELQTANEEVLSANEELQSSNEELETSRGELQSVNQELAATNQELEGKIKELEAANDDLASLINSTDIPTVFLDRDLNIRRYSTRATDLLRIRPGDIGRPLEDLASRVDDPNLLDDMRRVLDTLESVEREVAADQATYQRRAAPFMSSKGKGQGVIVTYSDVTRLRDFASRLQRQACCQASVVNLGQRALESEDLGLLFDEICAEMAQVVGADYVGIQRHDEGADTFSLIAGHGWPRGIAGATQTSAAEMNELRYAMTHHNPVVIEDMSIEMRFAPSQLVRDVSVHSGICLAIGPVAAPWGVLNVFWQDEIALDDEKVNYIISVTSILWLAINQSQVKLMREGERAELQELIDGLPIMVAVVGADMQVDLFNKAWQDIGVTSEETRGAILTDLLGPSARQISDRIKALSQKTQREGFEFSISVPGRGERVHLLYCVPRFVNGQPQGFFFAAIDINERKEWEERNRVISAELDHRVKNILALVNTIARMTGRNARDYEEFKEVFANRIDSMARTHSHLAAEKWDGTELRHLISEELEAYAVPDMDSITLEGPRVSVGPAAAQSIALAIHEMTTNAAKYGALAKSGGKLLVRWEAGRSDVHLIWSETGVGPVAEPERTGFGATVVRNAIVNQLRGALEMQFGEDGLTIDISIPLASIRVNMSGE